MIILGVIISPIAFPFLLFYAVPLVCIGAALIVFRSREDRIEQAEE